MKEYFLSTIKKSKDYTLAVAAAMDEKNYDTTTSRDSMNFAEQLNHISYGIQWWNKNFILGAKEDWNPPVNRKRKVEIIDYLKEAYDELQKSVSTAKMNDDLIQGFQATLDHITHHRGQAVLYLRFRGIVPPEYTF